MCSERFCCREEVDTAVDGEVEEAYCWELALRAGGAAVRRDVSGMEVLLEIGLWVAVRWDGIFKKSKILTKSSLSSHLLLIPRPLPSPARMPLHSH